MTTAPIVFLTIKENDIDGDDEDDLRGSINAADVSGATIETQPLGLRYTVVVRLRNGGALDDISTDDREAAKRRVGAVRTAIKAANGEDTTTPPAATKKAAAK